MMRKASLAFVILNLTLGAAIADPPFKSAFTPQGGAALPDFWIKRVEYNRLHRGYSDLNIRPGSVDEMRRATIHAHFPQGNEIAQCNQTLGALRVNYVAYLAAQANHAEIRRSFADAELKLQLARLREARNWVAAQAALPQGELGKRLAKYQQSVQYLSRMDFEADAAPLSVVKRQVANAKRQAEEIRKIFRNAMPNSGELELEFEPQGKPPRFDLVSACTARGGVRYCSTSSYLQAGVETGTSAAALHASIWGPSVNRPDLTLEQYFDEQVRKDGLLTACLDFDSLYGDRPNPPAQAASDRQRSGPKDPPPVHRSEPGEDVDSEGAE